MSALQANRCQGVLLKSLALLVAAALWLPWMHLIFKPDPDAYRSASGIAPKARLLAAIRLADALDGRRNPGA